MADIDITKNIQITEELKCEILRLLAELYTSMSISESKSDRTEILSDMLTDIYLLGQLLGVTFQNLDRKALNRSKARALAHGTDEDFSQRLMMLSKHLSLNR